MAPRNGAEAAADAAAIEGVAALLRSALAALEEAEGAAPAQGSAEACAALAYREGQRSLLKEALAALAACGDADGEEARAQRKRRFVYP
ncbi:MAG: hypothetical protein GWP75_11550 [Planctomycetia bacterium]|nr:hypothetical protein [Planctomycetia bacterium]